MQKLKEGLKDLVKNQYPGMYAFWIHRITGIAITLFLFIHIWTLSAVFRGRVAYDHVISKFDTTFGYILQYILLLVVALHLLNGIRITIVDFWHLTRLQRKLLWISFFIFLIISIIGIFTIIL
jgi:succinate dehydrogenase / fumarate reductase, cytochrome b subunit